MNPGGALADGVADLFPESSHVALVGLERASDEAVWVYAKANGFVIVTKDADFNDLSILRGFPPKVVWLRLGNCTTAQIECAIREHRVEIEAFAADSTLGVFTIF